MTCRTVVELSCRAIDASLSPLERVGLGIHTLLCRPCRQIHGQLIQLHAICEASRDESPSTLHLSADAHERIAEALNRVRHEENGD